MLRFGQPLHPIFRRDLMVRRPPLRPILLAASLLACATAPPRKPDPPAVEAWKESVKVAVGPTWKDAVTKAALEHDPTGCRYSWKDRRTVLCFTVDREGQLSNIRVLTSSGVEYLDKVAVDAFRSVNRLNPPPAETLGGRSSVELPFAFTLQEAKSNCGPRSRWEPPRR